jgi:hypothetical protein
MQATISTVCIQGALLLFMVKFGSFSEQRILYDLMCEVCTIQQLVLKQAGQSCHCAPDDFR